MNKNWLSIKLLLIIIIGSFVLGGTVRFGTAQTERWSLSKVPIPNGASATALDMVSATDGWAVGSDGCILHWDGASWSNVASPTTAQLNSVDMVSSTEGYAIAYKDAAAYEYNEVIIRWDGTSWNNLATVNGIFKSIDMVSSTDGWVVGPGATILRWDGTSWDRVEPVTYPVELLGVVVEEQLDLPLESVNMVSSTEGWAVGQRAVIVRWNGTNWSVEKEPEFMGAPWLWSVDMVSSTDGWAVGSGGDILRWDGTSWEYVTSPIPANKHLFSVDMVTSTDGWAVGSDGCIIHWDGASWSNVTSPTAVWLSYVDMVSSTEGWIVGADGIYRWQEATGFPTDYLIILIAVIVVVVVVVGVFTRNRIAHARTESSVSAS